MHDMTTTAQTPFPIFVPDGHRGERSRPLPSPNTHPYPIKTTSTGLLTRSNSSGTYTQSPKYYVPTTPSPSSKHRHSRSDISYDASAPSTSPSPRPLPAPPRLPSQHPSSGPVNAEGGHPRVPSWRTRAETLPAAPISVAAPVTLEDLPSNPRAWTTAQLASYLITALRVRSGRDLPLPLPVTRDIAAFVKDARLTGRTFLRLTEQDLEAMGINNLWRTALLNASRNLRQNVLKGRIWGFDDTDVTPPSSGPFSNVQYNLSSSSVEDDHDTTPSKRSGRVRGMVATLERSASSSSSNGSQRSTSPNRARCGAWVDEEALASGSGSDADDEHTGQVADADTCQSPVDALTPLTPPDDPLQLGEIPAETEPSMKELLSASHNDHSPASWGAQAWEEIDLHAGITVKRVAPVAVPASDPKASIQIQRLVRSEGRATKGARTGANALAEIFARPLPTPPIPGPGSRGASPSRTAAAIQTETVVVKHEAGTGTLEEARQITDVDMDTDLALEVMKMHEMRALMEQFRVRLADVEKSLEEMERKDAERDARCARELELQAQAQMQNTVSASGGDNQVEATPSEGPPIVEIASPINTLEESPAAKVISLPDDDKAETVNTTSDAAGPSTTLSHPPNARKRQWRELGTNTDWDPLDAGLPSYVLLVGLGVCAVVVRTMLRRWAGRRT